MNLRPSGSLGIILSIFSTIGKIKGLKRLFQIALGKMKRQVLFIDVHKNIKFKLNISDYITKNILINGFYEKKSVELALRVSSSIEGCFVDLGANFGLYSVYISKINQKDSIAIDGSSKAIDLLNKNIEINNLFDKIKVFSGVVSGSNSILSFGVPHIDNLGTSKIVDQNHDVSADYFSYSITFDQLYDYFIGDNKKIALMKIDLEGHEYEVLRNSEKIKKCPPSAILFEFFGISENEKKLFDYFISLGYLSYNVLLDKYTLGDEIPECNILMIKPDCLKLINK